MWLFPNKLEPGHLEYSYRRPGQRIQPRVQRPLQITFYMRLMAGRQAFLQVAAETVRKRQGVQGATGHATGVSDTTPRIQTVLGGLLDGSLAHSTIRPRNSCKVSR